MYRDYDVFVLPTLPGEGIPRVLLEAMTAGLPIVTTRVSGIPGLVTHQVNGWLVEQPTAEAVADAMARIIGDAPLRQRLIANGYETARGFTLDAQAARLLSEVAARLPVTLRNPTTVRVALTRSAMARTEDLLRAAIAGRRRRRARSGADPERAR